MDKNAIKKYAIWARKELIARVTQKAEQYEITAERTTPAEADSIGGRLLTAIEKKQRAALIEKIRQDGFEQVMEEVAYTWFNRFTALRFMEVNNYLPSHTRVFTNEAGEFKPQILEDANQLELEGLNMDKVYDLMEANKTEELYKYLIITQCNALSSILPGMFQKIADYTELLFPDYLLREGSVVEQMITIIPENNFDVSSEGGQIEIIGWLYQYYISEKHEEVVDPLHGKVVKKEEVPAATQLFTTDWVVRYLIDNSVGRYWIERNPESKIADELTYFVKPKAGVIKTVVEKITPQDVTVFDPCVGSGHFLVYAFDVLMKIYVEYGYSERDAAAEIVKNNLYGLDIDGRAAQLAYFAVMMKARQYDRRFLTKNIQPNVYEIAESNTADRASIEHFCGSDVAIKKDVEAVLEVLKDAKEYGSILKMPKADFEKINERFTQIDGEISMYKPYLLGDFQHLFRTAEIMGRRYAVVATNPPYMNKYDDKLKDYINSNYKDYSGDLFSVFIYRNFMYCCEAGFSGMMTPYVWMSIKSYEKLREYIVENKHISTLIQMEYSAYEEATVPICSFVLCNENSKDVGSYFDLTDFTGGMAVQDTKLREALANPKCNYLYESNQSNFEHVTGTPITAYTVSDKLLCAFDNQTLSEIATPKVGLQTGENNRFVRLWFEVGTRKLCLNAKSREDAQHTNCKWFPYNKGGDFRKWYGNNDFVVNWENDGNEIRHFTDDKGKLRSRPQNVDTYFRESITWSKISSGTIAFRYKPFGHIYDVAGTSVFASHDLLMYLQGFCNSCVAMKIATVLSPTINYEVGHIASFPIIIDESQKEKVNNLVSKLIDISRSDWDSMETSWDFEIHPLVELSKGLWDATATAASMDYYYGKLPKTSCPIETCFWLWQGMCNERFKELKNAEEELNHIFIDIYGLQEELTPEVEDKDVTVRKADLQRDIKSLISYAVGCMFGRYSVDNPGLIYAGGEWNETKYHSFKPDADAIIPICDDEYFEDDIVGRFISFIEIVFGKKSLEENLKYIADALGGKGSTREVIRNYFLNDFYVDHVKTYQKRPIYWLFDSGNKNGFKCLVYMHRFKPDTIARIRTDYIHEQQARYRTAIADLENRINGVGTSDRVRVNKQLTTLQAQAEELREYEEKIHHFADQMISINLDDGVKHNYEIFKGVLANIK